MYINFDNFNNIDFLILFLIIMAVIIVSYKCYKTYCENYEKEKTVRVTGGGKKLKRKLMPIMDPKFNMREVAKQCILLEEHLNQKAKACLDCQKKHFLTVEGLLEEAVSLDKKHKYTKDIPKWVKQWIDIQKDYVNKKKSFEEIAQEIRKFRKPIMYEFYENVKEYKI